MEKRLLVAVDASIYSSNTLHYLEQLFAHLDDVRFHLLSVITCNPSQAASEWLDELELLSTLSNEEQKHYASAKRYLKKAVDRLERNGISPDQVTTEVKISTTNPALEVLSVARKGLFDALVLGRRGVSKLEEFIMGSVSNTMFEKCHDVPIWIVDGQVKSRKFLVPVDGSFHSLMAVDHLAYILQDNPHAEVTLFHSSAMLAHKAKIIPEEYYEQWGKEWCDKYLTGPDSLHEAPKNILMQNGFSEDRIFWLHSFKGIEASRQIIRQALVDDFGTIVMGRRSEDTKKGIFKGVSDRVIYMAQHVAIWLVG